MKVIMKHRFEPLELKILRSLNARMSLSVNDKKNYFKLEKGFRGEQAFDERIQEISCNCIILNDLLLETNNTIFQIDSLLLANEKVYLFEVKNYEGDFYVQGDKWYTINNKQINSPLLQLERCDSLFQQTMQQLGFNLPLESYLIFINPEFMLYEAPLNSSIILPTQLNRFMQKLTSHTTKPNHHYEALTSKLLSIHLEESPFKRIPPYCYEDLKKE